MSKTFILAIGLLLTLTACAEIMSLPNTQRAASHQDIAVSAAQIDFIYDKIVHKWRKISHNSKFPLPYTARVELVYTPDGQLRFSHFETPSGNSTFDQELEQAIQLSSNLGSELPRPLEITLTFHHADMVRKNAK